MGLYAANNGPSLAMVNRQIDLTTRGPIIETIVVQRFRNTADRATEVTYIFPLPADSAVSAMAIRIGSRTIHAAIEGRKAAQGRYEAALKRAGLREIGWHVLRHTFASHLAMRGMPVQIRRPIPRLLRRSPSQWRRIGENRLATP